MVCTITTRFGGDPSLGAVRRRCDWLRSVSQRLEAEVEFESLDAYEKIDHKLLRSMIDYQLILFEKQREAERNPFQYPDNCMYGLYLLFTRDFAPLSERIDSIRKRMERTGAYLEQAKETVTSCPRIFAEIALEVTAEAPGFFDEVTEHLVAELPEQKDDILASAAKAKEAFADYENWVREELLPGASEEYAVGEEVFNARLQDEHMLDTDREKLEAYGVKLLADVQREMNELAERLSPGKNWVQVVEDAKKDHPPAEGVLDAYRDEVERGRRFLIDRRLTPIPEGEELEVIETPAFERSRIPYAAYLMPGPFDRVQRGSFYVTAVDPEASAEEIQATLLGHNVHTIPSSLCTRRIPDIICSSVGPTAPPGGFARSPTPRCSPRAGHCTARR